MESRLESIMVEEGTAMEGVMVIMRKHHGDYYLLFGFQVNSFRLPGHLPSESPKTTATDCMKKFGGEKGIDEYYRRQEEMVESFVEMDSIVERGYTPRTTQEERDNTKRGERFAIQISNIAKLVIFAAKVYACVKSDSLAIIASTLDSLLDLLSGFILWFTAVSMRKQHLYLYPIGKKRMQPLGILVFASVMATLGLQIILESARALFSQFWPAYFIGGLTLEAQLCWHSIPCGRGP